MASTYDDTTRSRRARLPAAAGEQAKVFEHAYEVALQVIELRGSRGLTQVELAERCGIDQADISRIERGATSPTVRTLQRIAAALDAEVCLVARPA